MTGQYGSCTEHSVNRVKDKSLAPKRMFHWNETPVPQEKKLPLLQDGTAWISVHIFACQFLLFSLWSWQFWQVSHPIENHRLLTLSWKTVSCGFGGTVSKEESPFSPQPWEVLPGIKLLSEKQFHCAEIPSVFPTCKILVITVFHSQRSNANSCVHLLTFLIKRRIHVQKCWVNPIPPRDADLWTLTLRSLRCYWGWGLLGWRINELGFPIYWASKCSAT